MSKLLNRIHLPMSGVMLSFAVLGNLIGANFPNLRLVLGGISGLLFFCLLFKLIGQPSICMEGMKNPVIATSFSTFDMGIMVLSTYIKTFSPFIAKFMWFTGIFLHLIILIYVIKTFILPFKIERIFCSYFVPFVGFTTASVTSPIFQMQSLGLILFYAGLLFYLICIPVIFYRIYIYKEIPAPLRPTNVIMGAPASLLLASYLNTSKEQMNVYFAGVLLFISISMTLAALYYLIKTFSIKQFYPTMAAYTFPFCISALALTLVSKLPTFSFLSGMAWVETVFAFLICIYVLICFIRESLQEFVSPK